jgi:hypothetical protein
MEELELNETTRCDRKWAWTGRNLARADDIRAAMDELQRWWPMTARQVYYRLISSHVVKQAHWHWAGKQVDVYDALYRTLKWMRIDDKLPWSAITDEHRVTTPKLGFTDVGNLSIQRCIISLKDIADAWHKNREITLRYGLKKLHCSTSLNLLPMIFAGV